jgi:hypothetical protein
MTAGEDARRYVVALRLFSWPASFGAQTIGFHGKGASFADLFDENHSYGRMAAGKRRQLRLEPGTATVDLVIVEKVR